MDLVSLKEGDKIEAVFLIKKFEVKTSKAGKKYLDAVFAYKNGEIASKMWDISSLDTETLSSGSFAKVNGLVEKYNSSLQLRADKITAVVPSQEEIDDLIECAPYPPLKMYEKILTLINQIENNDIKRLTAAIFEENKEKLLYYPAAKNFHHAVKGGLLYHIYTMFRCALPLLDVYDFLNKDLIYAGIALHDIGKIDEMESDQNGIILDYTAEGKLLGHIITTICSIEVKAKELNIDNKIAQLLKHMILTHHYYPEFGSPKAPMIAEAELLHHLDMMDSRMNQMKKTLDLTPSDTFAEKVWILDGRSLYNHALDIKEESNEII